MGSSNIYHHHLLYQRGLKQKQDMQKKADEARKAREVQERAIATFRPRINENSRLMVEGLMLME